MIESKQRAQRLRDSDCADEERRYRKMELSIVQLKQFRDKVERILHVPGNYRGGILEMTVVVDKNLGSDSVREILPQLVRTLKMHSEVFRNVRFNLAYWEQGGVKNEVCPMQMLLTYGIYEKYEQRTEEKSFEALVEYLKKFQARSKLIILLTDGKYLAGDPETVRRKMQPFLGKKLLTLSVQSAGIKIE